jgi:enamine deaminase RidA (YjgF/YER057c/UK114 family)
MQPSSLKAVITSREEEPLTPPSPLRTEERENTRDALHRKDIMGEREQKMISLGFSPECNLKAGAIYKPVVVDGTTVYVAGCVPFDDNQKLVSKGKVPTQVTLEDARKAAALCAANILRLVRHELGSLDQIDRMLKVTGFVNSDPDFGEQHLVINGASQLFVDLLGEAGWHARSAVGMAALPLGASVEVEAILKRK